MATSQVLSLLILLPTQHSYKPVRMLPACRNAPNAPTCCPLHNTHNTCPAGILNYCLSDYLWAHAVLLLGPTIATLGLSVQIPVAAVVEVLMGTPKWLSSSSSIAMTLSGTSLIMAGFFAGNLAGGGSVVGSHHRGGLLLTQLLQEEVWHACPVCMHVRMAVLGM